MASSSAGSVDQKSGQIRKRSLITTPTPESTSSIPKITPKTTSTTPTSTRRKTTSSSSSSSSPRPLTPPSPLSVRSLSTPSSPLPSSSSSSFSAPPFITLFGGKEKTPTHSSSISPTNLTTSKLSSKRINKELQFSSPTKEGNLQQNDIKYLSQYELVKETAEKPILMEEEDDLQLNEYFMNHEVSQGGILAAAGVTVKDKKADGIGGLIRSMNDSRKGLPFKTRTTGFRILRNVCTGAEVVKWMVDHQFAKNKQDAIVLGDCVCKMGLLKCVADRTGKSASSVDSDCFQNSKSFYCWTEKAKIYFDTPNTSLFSEHEKGEIEVLSDDLLLAICFYLSPRSLCSLCQVNKRLKKITETDEIWMRLYTNLFPHHKHAQETLDSFLFFKNKKRSQNSQYQLQGSPTGTRNGMVITKVGGPPSSSFVTPERKPTSLAFLNSPLHDEEQEKLEKKYKDLFRVCYLQEMKYIAPRLVWESKSGDRLKVKKNLGKLVTDLLRKPDEFQCQYGVDSPPSLHSRLHLFHFTLIVLGAPRSGKTNLIQSYFNMDDGTSYLQYQEEEEEEKESGKEREERERGERERGREEREGGEWKGVICSEAIGGSLAKQRKAVGRNEVGYEIWELSGRERFRPLIPMYLKHATGAILCVNPWDRFSFDSARSLLKCLVDNIPDRRMIAVVSTREDMRGVHSEDTYNLLLGKMRNEMKIVPGENIIPTSAITGLNVSSVFESFVQKKLEAID